MKIRAAIWSWMLVLSSFVCFAAAQQTEPARQRRTEVVTLQVHPVAATQPAWRYSLLPAVIDQRPGDGAPLYLIAARTGPDTTASDDLTLQLDDRFLALAMADLAKADVMGALRPFAARMEMLELAARREDAHWASTVREQGAAALLPYLRDMRINVRLLALKARWQIARSDWPGADRTLQTAFSMSQQMNDHALLIQGLIEAGVLDFLLDRVLDWVGERDAPNLYWSLTELPAPFIDLQSVRRWEQSMIYFTFPALVSRDPEQITAGEWREVFGNLDRMALSQGEKPLTADQVKVLVTATHPKAKEALVAGGMAREKTDAMPAEQAVGLYLFRQYLAAADEAWKGWQLPYWQVVQKHPNTDRLWDARRKQAAENPFMALIPIVPNARLQFARIDRKIALLRVVESLRDYAASHDNHFPQALEDLTDLPAPINPVTGRAFGYRFTGGTAVIEVEADYSGGATVEYRLTVGR